MESLVPVLVVLPVLFVLVRYIALPLWRAVRPKPKARIAFAGSHPWADALLMLRSARKHLEATRLSDSEDNARRALIQECAEVLEACGMQLDDIEVKNAIDFHPN